MKNQFTDQTIDVDVTAREDSPLDVSGELRGLGPGQSAVVDATVQCNGRTGELSVPLELDVHSDGGIDAYLNYTAIVVCTVPSTETTQSTTTAESGQGSSSTGDSSTTA